MASELRVNTSTNRVGLGTITYTDTGPIISGITTGNNFKTGTTNVHSTGVELVNINTGGATATFGGNVDIATGYLTISNDIKSSDDDFYLYSYKGGSDGQVRSGIQFDSTNQRLEFFTGTNERLRIVADGKVGINDTSPSHQLSVIGTTSFYGVCKVGANNDISPSSGGAGQLIVDANGYTPYIAADGTAMYVGHNSSSRDLVLQTDETDRITIDGSTGNVGIKQGSPRAILDVFETTTGNQTAIRIGNSNTPSSANDRRIEFVDGIGTTEGTNKFTYGYIQGYRQGGSNDGGLIFGTKPDNASAPSERLRIDSSGNLGLGGITTPLWTTGGGMHLNDAYGIGFGNGGSGRPDFQIACVDGSKLEFRCGFGADTADIVMETSGELGIGIQSPSSPLHAYHATTNTIAQFQSGDAGAGILLKDNTHYTRLESTNGTFKIDVDAGSQIGSEVISFQVSTVEKMRITSTGRIGMSQSSPDAATLHIGNSVATTGSNVALQVGTITGQNRYLTIHHFGNQQNFHSLKMRVNDNGLIAMLDMGNPYGSQNHGTKIKFSGYQDNECASIEVVNTANNNANAAEMRFKTGGTTERMRINKNGVVMINNQTDTDISDVHSLKVGGVFRHKTRNSAEIDHGFYAMSTGSGSYASGYFHMKTDMATNSSAMFLITIKGYAYGQGKVVFCETCGYCYSSSNNIINQQDKSWDGTTSVSTYKTSDGYVAIRFTPGGWSSYYMGFWVNISQQNPAKSGLNHKVTASAIDSSSTYYA